MRNLLKSVCAMVLVLSLSGVSRAQTDWETMSVYEDKAQMLALCYLGISRLHGGTDEGKAESERVLAERAPVINSRGIAPTIQEAHGFMEAMKEQWATWE